MQLTVANDGAAPLVFEEALHTYYAVADIHEVTVDGLNGVTYLTRTRTQSKVQHGAITVSTDDRVYLNTASTCVLHDTGNKRRIMAKTAQHDSNLESRDLAAKLPDLDPTEWHEFIASKR
jgi:glucose-6-phosphate 1-epimerase